MSACDLLTYKIRQEKGCLGCRLSQSIDNENIITLEQQWGRRTLLNDYFRTDHFTALLGAMKWLGQSYDIRINGGTPEEGMKIMKKERMKQ